jgi:diguanylate cyclase (GGDEF)-like protein/putative nucleotidyltransferase with HDIG domain
VRAAPQEAGPRDPTWQQLPFVARACVLTIVAASVVVLVASIREGASAHLVLLLFLVAVSGTASAVFLSYRLYNIYLSRIEDERRHAREISDLHMATVEALALAIEAKDASGRSHVQTVQSYATALARAMGLSRDVVQGIRTAALLHDIGKLGVPDHILSKAGPLTEDERDKARLHPEIGAGIVEAVQFPYPVAPLIRSHHERWDGSGYPAGLEGERIPLGARVIAVADRFDSLRRERPYRGALTHVQAVERLQRESGSRLDPAIVARFTEMLPALERELEAETRSGSMPRQPLASRDAGRALPGHRRDVLEDITRARQEFVALYEVAESMGIGLGVRDSMTLIAEKLSRLVQFSACALYIAEQGRIECRFASGVDAELLLRISMPRHDGVVGSALLEGRPFVNGDPAVDLHAARLEATPLRWRTILVCPLILDDMQAALAVYHEQPDFYSENDARLLERTSRQFAAVLYNARLFDRAQAESVTDALTELPNRRFLAGHAASEIARAQRSGTSFALLMIDLDAFKPINDGYGHAAGDAALKAVALALKRCLRLYDVCCRYAGDEFVVLLGGCSREVAEAKGLELTRSVESVRIELPDGTSLSVGCSIGLAMFPEDATAYETLLAIADSRMYSQKLQRRVPVTPGP